MSDQKIKKIYKDLVAFLETNKDKAIKNVLPEIYNLTRSKICRVEGDSFIKDKDGKLVAAMCFYYQQWMPLVGENAVEFGVKANTKTGLNTMSKAGLELWLAQQKTATQAGKQIIVDIKTEVLAIKDIGKREDEIELARTFVAKPKIGYETKLLLFLELQKIGVKLLQADLDLIKQPIPNKAQAAHKTK